MEGDEEREWGTRVVLFKEWTRRVEFRVIIIKRMRLESECQRMQDSKQLYMYIEYCQVSNTTHRTCWLDRPLDDDWIAISIFYRCAIHFEYPIVNPHINHFWWSNETTKRTKSTNWVRRMLSSPVFSSSVFVVFGLLMIIINSLSTSGIYGRVPSPKITNSYGEMNSTALYWKIY